MMQGAVHNLCHFSKAGNCSPESNGNPSDEMLIHACRTGRHAKTFIGYRPVAAVWFDKIWGRAVVHWYRGSEEMVERSSGPEEEEEEGRLSNLGSGKEPEVEGTKCRDEESGREKRRKERPELKVIICKDGRSSARVSVLHSSQTSQELRMLSRSLSDCKSLLLNVMIQVSQFIRNGQLCH